MAAASSFSSGTLEITAFGVRHRLKQVWSEWQLNRQPAEKPLWQKLGRISAEQAARFRAEDEAKTRAWWAARESDVALILMPRYFVEDIARTAGVGMMELNEELTKIEAENADDLQGWRRFLEDRALAGSDENLLDILRSAWEMERGFAARQEPEGEAKEEASERLSIPLPFFFSAE